MSPMRMYFLGLAVFAMVSPCRAETIVNLYTSPGTYTLTSNIGGNFLIANSSQQSTGTGVIDPFLTIQQKGSEQGFNTGSGTPLDDKAGAHNDTLTLGEIPYFTINGVDYFEFLLDVNQSGNGTVSLNQIEIFQSSSPAASTGYVLQSADDSHDAIFSQSGLTEVFRMDPRDITSASNQIIVDSANGSGSGDMFLYVQKDLFTLDPASYITMFSQFGRPPGSVESDAGFEEWAVRSGVGQHVPLPSSLALLLTGFPGVGGFYFWRRRQKKTTAA